MSEALQDSLSSSSIEDLPFSIQLDLSVEDRDTIRELARYAEGAERDEYALEALKIGVVALKHAAGAFDAEFIKKETNRLVESLDQQLNGHARHVQQRLSDSLGNYFDPDSGKFSERVKSLTADNGELAQLLARQIDGENSRLSKTLLAHVGEHSPLMKMLSPDQSQGLLAALNSRMSEQLDRQRESILREFSLDNPDSALKKMVNELTTNNGDFTKNMQGRIDEAIKQLSLDEEDSALNRLVKNVDSAQQTITKEFSLDNEGSALCRLKKELTTVLAKHTEENTEFREKVTIALEKLVTKRETEARGTQHGGTFQDAVFEMVAREAQMRGELADDSGNKTGKIKNCKVGDIVVELNPESVAAGARIVLEAKEDASYTLQKARVEMETARKNRAAQIGIFVFSKITVPEHVESLTRYGDDIVVVWDAEDPVTDAYLRAALEIARALCVRTQQSSEEKVDLSQIDGSILDIEKRASNLDKIRTFAQTIVSKGNDIVERVDIDQKALNKQVALLRETFVQLKQADSKSIPETVG